MFQIWPLWKVIDKFINMFSYTCRHIFLKYIPKGIITELLDYGHIEIYVYYRASKVVLQLYAFTSSVRALLASHSQQNLVLQSFSFLLFWGICSSISLQFLSVISLWIRIRGILIFLFGCCSFANWFLRFQIYSNFQTFLK